MLASGKEQSSALPRQPNLKLAIGRRAEVSRDPTAATELDGVDGARSRHRCA